jgi:hypothetical protein
MASTTESRTSGSQSKRFVGTIACASLLGVLATTGTATAQGSDTMTAEALFRQGKQLLDAKSYARACPMLAESLRLDPATGALLALATCHEQDGKLASAWSEFSEAAARSQREGRSDRVAAAKERMAALEPRLSMLTINVSDAIAALAGFELRRDGVVLGKAVLGVPVQVDGGEHTVEIGATGKKARKVTVTVGKEKDKKTVNVSSLEDGSVANTSAPQDTGGTFKREDPSSLTAGTSPAQPSGGLTGMQTGGLVIGGLGVVGIVVGSVFGLSAISKNNQANDSGCSASACTSPDAVQSRLDARAAGNVSTVAFVAGGVLAAAGVTLLVVGKRAHSEAANVSVVPAVAANGCGLSLQGAF